jgi:acyl carrier protein
MSANINKYKKAFTSTFNIDEKKLDVLKYQSIDNWDSIGHMSLISALEDSFSITFETDDIIDFSSFKKGKQILKKYKIII